MDIEDMGMLLSMKYDEIRDRNIQIENETAALDQETNRHLGEMEKEIEQYVKQMQQQMDSLLAEVKRDVELRTREYCEDVQLDMKAALDDEGGLQHNLRFELRDLRDSIREDLSSMQEQMNSAIEDVGKEPEFEFNFNTFENR